MIAIGVIVLLSGGLLAGRDAAGVSGAGIGPGIALRDQGDAVLRSGDLHPVYDSRPPTSGAHVPSPLPPDGSSLTDDQLLTALAAGDIVLAYPPGPPPPGLVALAGQLAPPDRPALATAGGAIILGSRPDATGIVALAWAHILRVASATDPSLRAFVSTWLGRGTRRPAAGG